MLITEISERDFRKLDLTLWKKTWVTNENGTRSLRWLEISANKELDDNIKCMIESGYEEDEKNISLPITLCVHVNNYIKEDREDYRGGGYFDKYLNMYSGESTYYMWVGIKHLYSNRDYYYDKEYPEFRVRKKETEAIYRIHLEPRPFVLKHKKEIVETNQPNSWIEIRYDWVDGEWVETGNRYLIKKNEGSTSYTPICKNDKIG